MAIVNKFNVNKQEVTLNADIIENMSANDVSYDASTQYNENTVGDKLSELESEVIFDVTKNNNEATFASLSELLSSENLSTLIPVSVRCGGMSIRFVQSSNNKYVQYYYMDTATIGSPNPFLDTYNWQRVDEAIASISEKTIHYTIANRNDLYWNGSKVIKDGTTANWGSIIVAITPNTLYNIESYNSQLSSVVTFGHFPQLNDSDILRKVGNNFISNSNERFVMITRTFNESTNISFQITGSLLRDIDAINTEIPIIEGEIQGIKSALGEESSEKTLVANDFKGIYWNGTSVLATGGTSYNGFVINVDKDCGILWNTQDVLSIVIFDEHPVIGSTTSSEDIKSALIFSNTSGNTKYLLVTCRTTQTSTFTYTKQATGLFKQINSVEYQYSSIKAIEQDRGLIRTPNDIYRKGDASYPYVYAIFEVSEGSTVKVTGMSVNTDYVCCSAGKSSNPDNRLILLTGTSKDFIDEKIVIPSGYDRLYVNSNCESLGYPDVKVEQPISEVINNLNERVETIEKDLDGISVADVVEYGSKLSQGEINQLSSKNFKLNVTNTSTPIVAFIYDDTYSSSLVQKFDERGLKVSFAIIGNIDKQTWATTGNALRSIQKNGHGTVAHGVVGSISVQGSGINAMNDADVKKALEGENKAFDDYMLSHRGLVEFNTWEDTAHTWALVGRYYDYLIGFGTPINTPGDTSLYELGRYNTDGANMLTNAINYVNSAIEKGNCLLIFGGHYLSRTGSGGNDYSTMEDFEALLDYVKTKVDEGLLLSMNIDDAVDKVWSRHNGILKKNYTYENPAIGELRFDNGIQYCSSNGHKAIYSISLSGTPVGGSFDITIGNTSKTTDTSNSQTLTISTESGQSIEDIVDSVVAKIYNAYSVRKKSSNEIILYRDIIGTTFNPYISNNSSGVIFKVVVIENGSDAVWI